MLNSQASIRNELQLLDDQMSQSAVQQARLTANNEKYLEERNDIAVRKAACEEELPPLKRIFTIRSSAFAKSRQHMNRKTPV